MFPFSSALDGWPAGDCRLAAPYPIAGRAYHLAAIGTTDQLQKPGGPWLSGGQLQRRVSGGPAAHGQGLPHLRITAVLAVQPFDPQRAVGSEHALQRPSVSRKPRKATILEKAGIHRIVDVGHMIEVRR